MQKHINSEGFGKSCLCPYLCPANFCVAMNHSAGRKLLSEEEGRQKLFTSLTFKQKLHWLHSLTVIDNPKCCLEFTDV